MANTAFNGEDIMGLDYDSRGQPIPYLTRQQWPMTFDTQMPQRTQIRRPMTPLQTPGQQFQQATAHQQHPQQNVYNDWRFQQNPAPLNYAQEDTVSYGGTYGVPMQTSPVDLIPATQPALESALEMNAPFVSMPQTFDNVTYAGSWHDVSTELSNYAHGLPADGFAYQPHSSSPTDTYLEVRSLTSSSSNEGWSAIERVSDYYVDPQTLHNRTLSDSSFSDLEPHPHAPFPGNFEFVSNAMHSPSSESGAELDYRLQQHRPSIDHGSQSSAAVSPVALIRPIPVPLKKSTSPTRSPTASASSTSPTRKGSRKSPIAKSTEKVIKKPSPTTKMEVEKKIGKRKGPLRPDQRKQASEIRKLRACLRCKFLKKTCDKGEPCAGCKPSHARLWQVPCTRIDIKEIGYFVKDWKADYERHVTMGVTVSNIKGFSDVERTLYITHGYGHVLAIKAREVFVRDEKCFGLDWAEKVEQENADFEVSTMRLSAGADGISTVMLSEYLDNHIDGEGNFERFIDKYFEGTPFLTQMLETAYKYYRRTNLPVLRKALKLVLAYNLTLHVTMVEGLPEEENFMGKVEDEESRYFGKTMAPVMINFQIKTAMASMWRELQKDVLEELSALYSSVYSGEKLKNWPTIFILASLLLAVWECMQFDCHYRMPDNAAVEKFCSDMETTPVGVIVGLFQAISQKLPAFNEWDTNKHHQVLNSNPDVCNTMDEVRDNVNRYEQYLRGRQNSKFDRSDFDCLSNKFLAKLVIRAN